MEANLTWNGTFSSTRTFASPFECYYVRVIFIVLYGSVFTICILGKWLTHIFNFYGICFFFLWFFFSIINWRCNRRDVHMIWNLPDYALYSYYTTNSKSCWVFYDDSIQLYKRMKSFEKTFKKIAVTIKPVFVTLL